jgi:PadR family transcriptional regulator PadR
MHYIGPVDEDFYLNWRTQVRKGILELSILNALAGARLYGYDIVRRLSEIQGLVISEGTIYPILSRLKAEKYLETTLEESSEGPARKYYRLTDRGRRELRKMNEHFEELRVGIEKLKAGKEQE